VAGDTDRGLKGLSYTLTAKLGKPWANSLALNYSIAGAYPACAGRRFMGLGMEGKCNSACPTLLCCARHLGCSPPPTPTGGPSAKYEVHLGEGSRVKSSLNYKLKSREARLEVQPKLADDSP